jgi:hypothetical protein
MYPVTELCNATRMRDVNKYLRMHLVTKTTKMAIRMHIISHNIDISLLVSDLKLLCIHFVRCRNSR